MGVGLPRGGFPAPPLAAHEVGREVGEQRPGLAVGPGFGDGGKGLLPRLGGGHVVGRAEDRPGRAELA